MLYSNFLNLLAKCLVVLGITLISYFNTQAQIQDTTTNRSWIKLLEDTEPTAVASLKDLNWLVGEWITTSKDLVAEHVILAPRDAQMPGFVRSVRSGKISFYEITTFVEVGHSVHYNVKHFTANLEGWKPKNKFINRPLIKIAPNAFFFNGITFRKRDAENFTVYFLIQEGERKGEVLVVNFRKVKDNLETTFLNQLNQLNQQITQSVINKEVAHRLDVFNKNPICMSEHQVSMQGIPHLKQYYQTIFNRQNLSKYERKTTKIYLVKNRIIELGTFEKQGIYVKNQTP